MSIQDVLQRITSALEQAGIAYMLSGSFAGAYYGAARSTQDIDFVIHASSGLNWGEAYLRLEGLPSPIASHSGVTDFTDIT